MAGACGTKFGKTYGCSIRIVKEAWGNLGADCKPLNGPGTFWWVAPSYAQATIALALVKRLLPDKTYIEYKADMKLVLLKPDGSPHSEIHFKSGDNPDTLRGYAVNFVVIDEAARIPYDSFVSVMTTLTQTKGRAIVISTPNGRGWFYDVYGRGDKTRLLPGEVDKFPEWMSIRMPTHTNPWVGMKEIEDARNNLPSDIFEQEYLAHFMTDGAGVFKNIKKCYKPGIIPEPPQKGHQYSMGVDLARSKDYTVIVVIDKTAGRNHVVYFDRFNQVDWAVQYLRIIQAAKLYNATVWMDSTGLGDPIVETIQNAGVRVEGYKISGSAPKQQLIEKLRVGIQNTKLSFPDRLVTMVHELESYEYDITEHGTIRYNAPEGKHDDCVISLALAWMGADQEPFIYRWLNARGI